MYLQTGKSSLFMKYSSSSTSVRLSRYLTNVLGSSAFSSVELVVSWTVWSHHLLSDQAQPAFLKVVSGELVTAFELITQGLAFFITLATLWLAVLLGFAVFLPNRRFFLDAPQAGVPPTPSVSDA